MAHDMTPGTQWQENVPADEALRFATYGQQFAAMQARKSKKYGAGRALHRKQLTAAKGSLDVLADLPDFARHGLFAKPGTCEAWVRLSNGGMDRAPDRTPDIRGFAVRVLGVQGDSALGNGPASPDAKLDWGADFSAKLREKSLPWDLQLQPYVDAQRTPIEDASVHWPSPYTTVARLTLPRQDSASAQGQALAGQVEAAVFDPLAGIGGASAPGRRAARAQGGVLREPKRAGCCLTQSHAKCL